MDETRFLVEEIERAREAGAQAKRDEPRAERARYDAAAHELEVRMSNGSAIRVPVDLLGELRGAEPAQLAAVRVPPSGYGLRWPDLDADIALIGILEVAFGSSAIRSMWGREAGRTKSEAKAAAARLNGQKGGRPRTVHEAAEPEVGRTGKGRPTRGETIEKGTSGRRYRIPGPGKRKEDPSEPRRPRKPNP